MARLDMTGVTDLWNRIGDVFARKDAMQEYVQQNAICSAGITFEPSTNLIKITFYNGKGVEVDSVAWTS